ncbi:hypothetical protein BJ741DRAFT_619941 [Chytriomyces cf. hyalinus JEL632]|nr:hypothetical protein BJ741DRAFT_619941 [Chytriomyces cf. hyalinus JEL632]
MKSQRKFAGGKEPTPTSAFGSSSLFIHPKPPKKPPPSPGTAKSKTKQRPISASSSPSFTSASIKPLQSHPTQEGGFKSGTADAASDGLQQVPSKRRIPTLRERERVYDVNLVTREMPLYEPLLDEGLQDYFSSSNIRKHLVNVGLISGDNRVIPKRQFNRNQVHLDRVAHEERNCKTEEERELDRNIEHAIRHHIRGEKNKYSKHNRLPMNVENAKKYPEYLSAYPVTMWKAAMLYAEKPPALELTEKQLFSQLTKMSAKRLREYGLDPNKVIPQLHHIKSKAKLKRVAPSVMVAKKAEVHDDLSEMEMEAEKMSPALKLFEMAKKQYEKRDLNATMLLLHELVRVVGGMPPSVSPGNSSEELDVTQEISSLSSVPLENSEIMLIGYIKRLGGNVDKVLKQIEANKRPASSAPTTSKIQTTIGRLSAPTISAKLRPSTARPSREAEYPIGSEFSDFGSDCGYEVTSQIMAVKEDLVSKASHTVEVVHENDQNVRNSAADKGATLAENMKVPEVEYDIQADEMFEDFTELENATASNEGEQGSIYESHPGVEQTPSESAEQIQLHGAISEDFASESLQQHQSGSFTSQSSIADSIDIGQSRSKRDVSASMDYIAAISAVDEPPEAVGLDKQVSSALQETESMTIHDEQIDANEVNSALEEFFEKSASNLSFHDIREGSQIAAETCETLTAEDPYDNYPSDEADVDKNVTMNLVQDMQLDEEGHIYGVAQYESPQSISKETLTDAVIHDETVKSQVLDENLAERPIVEAHQADWEGDFSTPPEPTQEENTAASFETISSFADGYDVDERSMNCHSEPNIGNDEKTPAEARIGEVDQVADAKDSSQGIGEGEVLEHDVGTCEERVDEETVLDAAVGHLNNALSDLGKSIAEDVLSAEGTNEVSHNTNSRSDSVQRPNKGLLTGVESSQRKLMSRETSSKDLASKKSVAFSSQNLTDLADLSGAGANGDGEGVQRDSDANESHSTAPSCEETSPPQTLEISTGPISQPVEDIPGEEIVVDETEELGQLVVGSIAVPLEQVDVDQVTYTPPIVKESILSHKELSEESEAKESETSVPVMQDVTASSHDTLTAEHNTEELNSYEESNAVDSERSAGAKPLPDPHLQNQGIPSEADLNAHTKSAESINYEDDFDVAGFPAADDAQAEEDHDDEVLQYQYASDDNIAEQDTTGENGVVQEKVAVEAAFPGNQADDTGTSTNHTRQTDDVSRQGDNESKSASAGVNENYEEGVILSETTVEPTSNGNHDVRENKADDEWELDEMQNRSVNQGQDQEPSGSSMSLSNGYGDDFEEVATVSGSLENMGSPSTTDNSHETDVEVKNENADLAPRQSKLLSSSVSGSIYKLSASAESVKRSVTFSQTLEQPETAPLQIHTQGNDTAQKNSPSINLNGSTASITSEEEYTAPPFFNRKSIISDRKPSMLVSSLIRRASKLSPTSMEGTISFPPAYTETMEDLIDSIHGRPSRQMLDRRPSAKSPLNVTLPVDSDSEGEEDQETVIQASAVLGASPTTAKQIAQISNQSVDGLPTETASVATITPLETSNQNLVNLNNQLSTSVGDTSQEQGIKPTISRPDLNSASKPSSRPQSIVTMNRVGAASSTAISPSKEGSSPSLNVVSNIPRKSRLQQVAGTSNPSISLNGSITSLSSSNGDSDSDYVSPTFMTRASISPDRKSSMFVTSLIRRASHASPTSGSPGLTVSKMSPTHDDTEDLMDSVFRRPSRMFVDRRQSMRSPLATSLPADSNSESEDENGNKDVQLPSQNHIEPQASASLNKSPSSTGETDVLSQTSGELLGHQSDPVGIKISASILSTESNDAPHNHAIQGDELRREAAPLKPRSETTEPQGEEMHKNDGALDKVQEEVGTSFVGQEATAQEGEEPKLEAQSSSEDFVTPRESLARMESIHAGNLDEAEKFETPRQSVLLPEGTAGSAENANVQPKTASSESDVFGTNDVGRNQSTDSMNLAALLHSVLDLNPVATDGNDNVPGSSEPYQDTNYINALANADETSSTPSIHELHHSIASLPQEVSPILEQVMRAVNAPSVTKAPESLESLNLAQLFQSVLNLSDDGVRAHDQPSDVVKSPARSSGVQSRTASVHSIHSQASDKMNARYKSVPSLSSRQESKTSSRKTSDAHVSNQKAPINSNSFGSANSSKKSSIANLPNASAAAARSSLAQPTPPKEPHRIASGLSKSASKNASAVSLNITNRIKSAGPRQGSQSSLTQQAAKTSSNTSDKQSVVNSRNGSVSASPSNRSNGRLANQSQRTSVAENKASPKMQSLQTSKPASRSHTQKNSIAASRTASANVSQQSLLMQALATAASLIESSSSASSPTASPELKDDISRPSTAFQQEAKQTPVPHAPLGNSTSSKSSSASSLRGSSYRVGKQNKTGKADTSETPRTPANQQNDKSSLHNQDSEIEKGAGVSVWDDILNYANTS